MDATEAPESHPVCLQVLCDWADTHQNKITNSKAVRKGMAVQGWEHKGMRLHAALSMLRVS